MEILRYMGVCFGKVVAAGLCLNLMFWVSLAEAKEPVRVVGHRSLGMHEHVPGAEVIELEFNDGMLIKIAVYPITPGRPPVGVIAGYTGSMGYLHNFAESLANQRANPFLIQPPGQGKKSLRSYHSAKSDGIEYTIEGVATRYLLPLNEYVSSTFYDGKKIALMGHSRAGYMVRALLSGMQVTDAFDSVPKIDSDATFTPRMRKTFSALYSLLSPLRPEEDLVSGMRDLTLAYDYMENLERLSEVNKQFSKRIHELIYVNHSVRREVHAAINGALLDPFGIFGIKNATRNWYDTQYRVLSSIHQTHVDSSRRTMESLGAWYIKSDLPPSRLGIELSRLTPLGRAATPPADLLIRAIELDRKMLHPDPAKRRNLDTELFRHLMGAWDGTKPTAQMEAEMIRMSEGGASWKFHARTPDGDEFPVIKGVFVNRAMNRDLPPLHILHADGDGNLDANRAELRMVGKSGPGDVIDPRSQFRNFDCGHGGGVTVDQRALREIAGFTVSLIPSKGRGCRSVLENELRTFR